MKNAQVEIVNFLRVAQHKCCMMLPKFPALGVQHSSDEWCYACLTHLNMIEISDELDWLYSYIIQTWFSLEKLPQWCKIPYDTKYNT